MDVRGTLIVLALVPVAALADDAVTAEKVTEKEPVAKPEPAEKAKAFTWEPYGYLRMQYVVVQNDPNVQFVGRDDGFELQNARVGVRGKLDNRAAFAVSIDGAVDERAQINTPEGKLKVGLRDAFADLFVRGETLFVRAGFFHSLADPESLIPDTKRAFVDKPLASRGIRATEGYQTQGLTPGRSIGAALRMDPGHDQVGLGFELAVQNGADEFASNNDNDKPAVSASGLFRFTNDSHLVATARYNPRTEGDLPFRQDENDLMLSGGALINVGIVSVAAGGVFIHTTFPTTGGPAQNAVGGHGQVMVWFGAEEMPIGIGYRFCLFDPSSLITTDRVMEHTAGAVLGVPAYRMRVQLQATYVDEQRQLTNSRIQLAAEVAL